MVNKDVYINPLMGAGNYSATSSNMEMVHWPLMGGLLHFVQRGGIRQGRSPLRSLLAVPNVISPPSTASVAIIVLLYDGPLLCGFNVSIKGLTRLASHKVNYFHSRVDNSRSIISSSLAANMQL